MIESARSRRIAWAIAIAVVVAALVCTRLTFWERSLYVSVRSDGNDGVMVEWRTCGSRRLAPERSATIYLKGYSESQDFECTVLPVVDASGVPPLQREWRYGSSPPGYTTSGSCPALEVGREYKVSIGTFGSAKFRMLPNGSVEVTDR
ncbi:MAG TPA: hypothetical protein VKP30_34020, partial [Polyangiaceae bacterium]|nr:hypothetical protein [Polyangiaceae bacterium]